MGNFVQKIQKRVQRGVPGKRQIASNKVLDKASKEHDMFYRDKKNAKSRNEIVDNILHKSMAYYNK